MTLGRRSPTRRPRHTPSSSTVNSGTAVMATRHNRHTTGIREGRGHTVPRIADLHPGHRLAAALLDQWPSYLAYALSFLNVLIMWVNHHALFRIIRRTDHLFLLLNGLLLLMEPFFEDASPYMFADQVDLTGLEKVNEKYNTQIVGPPLPA